MENSITSIQNPLVKKVLLLQDKSRARRKEKLFVVEGIREFRLALKGGYKLFKLLICKDIIEPQELDDIQQTATDIIYISKEIYHKLSHRKTTEGLISIFHIKELDLNNLKLSKQSLILVAEAPEKPGNIGALLRTADAANIDAVIIANPKTDFFNPNIIRSSVGCVFTTQIASGSTDEIISFLKNNHINIYAAALSQSSIDYKTIDFSHSSAIVVGTEATGLSESWLEKSSKNIIIPMEGEIDSLNVSVSAAIIIFEAKRQRHLAI